MCPNIRYGHFWELNPRLQFSKITPFEYAVLQLNCSVLVEAGGHQDLDLEGHRVLHNMAVISTAKIAIREWKRNKKGKHDPAFKPRKLILSYSKKKKF